MRQLRDVGGRLEYLVARYSRLLRDATEGIGAAADLRDTMELMDGQLGYVARRLQELLVADFEERHASEERVAEELPVGVMAIGS